MLITSLLSMYTTMATHTAFLLLTIVGVACGSGDKYPGCELLSRSTYCSRDMQHNFVPYSDYVGMPNIMGDETQAEAGSAVDSVSQYVANLGVSTHLDNNYRLFTCSMFLPPCLEDGTKVQPCRSLCEKARVAGRELERKGHPLSDEFRCDKYPDATDSRILCIPPVGNSGDVGTGGAPIPGGDDDWVEEDWEKDDKGPMVPASQCLDITRPFSLNKCTCTCPP